MQPCLELSIEAVGQGHHAMAVHLAALPPAFGERNRLSSLEPP